MEMDGWVAYNECQSKIRTVDFKMWKFVLALLFVTVGVYAEDGVLLETLVWRYGLHRSDDAKAGKITLVAENLKLILALDMEMVLINGKSHDLGDYVRRTESGVVVPAEVERLIVSSVRREKREDERVEKRVVRVVIDPGHGGKFAGAVQNGIEEKALNLVVSLKVSRLLRERGVKVFLTRSSDRHLSGDWSTDLNRRVDMSNRLNADLFVSIHANSSRNKRVRGSDVFIARESEDEEERVTKAMREAPTLIERYGELLDDGDGVTRKIVHRLLFEEKYRRSSVLAKCVASALKRNPFDSFNRINDCGFRVVKWTRAPAVLIEMGFISNPETAERFKTESYRVLVAELIADGIMEYVRKVSESEDFSDSRRRQEAERKTKRMQPKDGEGASYRDEGAGKRRSKDE